jgi:hypothetical protein
MQEFLEPTLMYFLLLLITIFSWYLFFICHKYPIYNKLPPSTYIYSLTLNIFIHNSFGLICIIRAVEAGCLLSRETLDLMPVVLARIRGVLVADGPPLEDTLTEMLRRLVLVLERVKELAESVVATKFKQLYFL